MNKKFYASLLLSTALFTLSASADSVLTQSGDFKVTFGADTNFQGGVRFQSKSKTRKFITTNQLFVRGLWE